MTTNYCAVDIKRATFYTFTTWAAARRKADDIERFYPSKVVAFEADRFYSADYYMTEEQQAAVIGGEDFSVSRHEDIERSILAPKTAVPMEHSEKTMTGSDWVIKYPGYEEEPERRYAAFLVDLGAWAVVKIYKGQWLLEGKQECFHDALSVLPLPVVKQLHPAHALL